MTIVMGERIDEARGEVMLGLDIIDYYAKNAEFFLTPKYLIPDSGESVIEYRPVGVLFEIQPWNIPYYQLERFAAPNLMAGNVVMVKLREAYPLTYPRNVPSESEVYTLPVGSHSEFRTPLKGGERACLPQDVLKSQ